MAEQLTRPAPPAGDVLAGYEWVVEDGGLQWRLVSRPQIRCRYRGKDGQCENPAVVELNRGRYVQATRENRDSWWAYCLEHSYERWVEGGKVVMWALRPAGGEA